MSSEHSNPLGFECSDEDEDEAGAYGDAGGGGGGGGAADGADGGAHGAKVGTGSLATAVRARHAHAKGVGSKQPSVT